MLYGAGWNRGMRRVKLSPRSHRKARAWSTVRIVLSEIQHAIASRPADRRLVFLSDYDGTLAEFIPIRPCRCSRPRAASALLARASHRSHRRLVSGRRIAIRTRTHCRARRIWRGCTAWRSKSSSGAGSIPTSTNRTSLCGSFFARLEPVRATCLDCFSRTRMCGRRAFPRRCTRASDSALAPRRRARHAPAKKQLRGSRCAGGRILTKLACHKGDATRRIARDVESRHGAKPWVVFVGDDITDEDAFRAIESGVGVLVGSRPSAARHQLGSSDEVEALIRWIADKG